MKEDFLHYLWKYRKFHPGKLKSDQGEYIQIIHPGFHNRDGGPDFLNAKIKIGDTLWAGNVEIHVQASDWYRHGHHLDDKYQNVILHVVAKNDKKVHTNQQTEIPCLNISSYVSSHNWSQYQKLLKSAHQIPCTGFLSDIEPLKINLWLERLLTERLASKTERAESLLEKLTQDWEALFFVYLARYLGGTVNAMPMEMLAMQTPYKVLLKHADNLYDLESIFFGQSGILSDVQPIDEYANKLKRNYLHFQKLYNLKPINQVMWQFLRLRPGSFPTIRIAQLAALYHQTPRLFGAIVHASKPDVARGLLTAEASAYWRVHYRFSTKTKNKRTKRIGKSTTDSLLINVVAPFLFLYGKARGELAIKDKALEWLNLIPAEKNRLTKTWQNSGVTAENAAQSQALIQLKKEYCNQKRCLECAIGHEILNKTKK